MRGAYLLDWSSATISRIEKLVESNFPQEGYRWPLIRAHSVDSYSWRNSHLIMVFRDKLSGVPSVGGPEPLEDPDAPFASPSLDNISEWHSYMRFRFNLRLQDSAIVIPLIKPVVDRGMVSDIKNDWKLWSNQDKNLWNRQIEMIVTQQFYFLKGFSIDDGFLLPPGYWFLADDCERFLTDHPQYDRNVFIMTRFVRGNRLLESLDRELRRVLREHDLNPLRADDKMYLRDRNLWNNVCVYMICCRYGVAILEDRVANEFNPNVALEYGFMRALNKPVLLLADAGFRNLRADIIGTLREEFDITDIEGTIGRPIRTWLDELGIASQ